MCPATLCTFCTRMPLHRSCMFAISMGLSIALMASAVVRIIVRVIICDTRASTALSRGKHLQQELQPSLNTLAYSILMANVLMALQTCPAWSCGWVLMWDATGPAHWPPPRPYCFGFQSTWFGGRTDRADHSCRPTGYAPFCPHWHWDNRCVWSQSPLLSSMGSILVNPFFQPSSTYILVSQSMRELCCSA